MNGARWETGSARSAIKRGEREGLTVDERSEPRVECVPLRMERDLLQRSMAFWVKEPVRGGRLYLDDCSRRPQVRHGSGEQP